MPPQWDANPQSQQASSRRPTPWTVQPLGPAIVIVSLYFYKVLECYTFDRLDGFVLISNLVWVEW